MTENEGRDPTEELTENVVTVPVWLQRLMVEAGSWEQWQQSLAHYFNGAPFRIEIEESTDE